MSLSFTSLIAHLLVLLLPAEGASGLAAVHDRVNHLDFGDVLHQQMVLRGGIGGSSGKARTRRAAAASSSRPPAPSAAPQPTTSGRDVLFAAATSFGLVGTALLGVTTTQRLLGGVSAPAALLAGARSGLRWGRVSAAFNGMRTAGQWRGLPDGLCSALGAAAAGAAGARAPAEVPARAAAFVTLAVGLDAGGPVALAQAKALRRWLDSELQQRREQFARTAPRPPPSAATPATPRACAGAPVAGAPPWQRLQRLIDQLNAELGHVG